mmetsp:Transcript_45885/g.90384  ORF Transcript_45885/g.90384 Transcript_45885/m.90384 type:complete len:244 (-) Transcript_45885:930-1661(-)
MRDEKSLSHALSPVLFLSVFHMPVFFSFSLCLSFSLLVTSLLCHSQFTYLRGDKRITDVSKKSNARKGKGREGTRKGAPSRHIERGGAGPCLRFFLQCSSVWSPFDFLNHILPLRFFSLVRGTLSLSLSLSLPLSLFGCAALTRPFRPTDRPNLSTDHPNRPAAGRGGPVGSGADRAERRLGFCTRSRCQSGGEAATCDQVRGPRDGQRGAEEPVLQRHRPVEATGTPAGGGPWGRAPNRKIP